MPKLNGWDVVKLIFIQPGCRSVRKRIYRRKDKDTNNRYTIFRYRSGWLTILNIDTGKAHRVKLRSFHVRYTEDEVARILYGGRDEI